ncbi:hypothetical protein [Actibacterium sp. XHP0104]|uniref:hypothetical protein n=1 Tax=Actibacterium sp. XHP0104 TaxID=2984335 RepID=UPI0021E98760|nr:hypothetical protein [Actibacterium sp. XHP0104]MCV2882645.1 hypothetical protein [Actibacterium sp. XHP0104]
MARLVIHCGLHKAGSTSIQHLLRANKKNLPGNVLYVSRGLPPFTVMLQACRDFDPKQQQAFQARIQKSLSVALEMVGHQPGDTLILSSEDFMGTMPATRQARPLYYQAPSVLRAIETSARALGYEVEFVICLRERDSWLRSWHKHQLLWRPKPIAWDELIQREWVQDYDPAALVGKIREKVTAPLHVIRFEDEVKTRLGPGTGVLRVAGLNADQLAALRPVAAMQRTPRPWVFDVARSPLLRLLPAGLRTRFKVLLVRLDRYLTRG